MNVKEFRAKIRAGQKIMIDGRKFNVEGVIKFRLDDGSYYIKCFLSDDYIFADDLNENIFILVKALDTTFKKPFPKKLEFKGKKFNFLYTAHAVAEKIEGKTSFEKGGSERFWDYQANDDSYLSLGISDQTGERMDCYGKIIDPKQVDLPKE
jgi:hypothetical protein